MKILTHTLIYSLLAAAAQAGSIRGIVVDPAGRTVAGARVAVPSLGATVYSRADGVFSLTGLGPGPYRVEAAVETFEPVAVDGILPGGPALTLRFEKVRSTSVQVDVVGPNPEVTLKEIPGSAFLVQAAELRASRPLDANEVLRNVPGLHVREDSGPAGMRLNIGVRGLNPDRSRSLLVLEDGLPLALAPYGEPEMYYSPPIDRMSRVELLKGSGSILHGPQTIGGVLNFITPDPPPHPQGSFELTGGQRGFFTAQASYGGTKDSAGWHINALRKQGDGWRSFYFDINDVLAKLTFDITAAQRLGVKLAVYDEKSNSTYLGLTETQFRRDANFNAVPDDLLRVRRYSGSLAHQFAASPSLLISSTLFAYTTARNWRRQDFDRAPRPGIAYTAVYDKELFLRNSTGNNNREFDVAGAESRAAYQHNLFGRRNTLDSGVRYVYEQHRDRRIDGATRTALSGLIREDETRYGGAWSAWVQNRVFLTTGWSVTPGVRFEKYSYLRDIHRQPVDGIPADVNVRKGDSVAKAIPGIGTAFQVAAPLTVFAGVHRGFAPPRVKDAITRSGVSLELDAELSWNYEAGARLSPVRGIRAEATWFLTDFENQIIPASQSGGATSTLINAGETVHKGVELLVHTDWQTLSGGGPGIWTEFRHTYLATARFASGIYGGNRLPYAPRHVFGMLAGYRHRSGFHLQIDGARAGSQFSDNRMTVAPTPDGTIGLLPPYWVWNAAAGRDFQRERFTVSPFVTVKNLADNIYISSRAPQGIQPGMFRQANAGVKFRF